MTTQKIIDAKWDSESTRYIVKPGSSACDVSGKSGMSGWHSDDGNEWLDFGGGYPAGEFDDVAIRLVGGPRSGDVVS